MPASILSDNQRLLNAASKGEVCLIKLQLERGAEIGAKDLSGKTALHHAVLSQNAEAVEILLQNGAQVAVAEQALQSPLSLAVFLAFVRDPEENARIVKLLVEAGSSFPTRLHQAAYEHDLVVLEQELRSSNENLDEYINLFDQQGFSLILWATARKGARLTVEKLLPLVKSPLQEAAVTRTTISTLCGRNGDTDTLKLILEKCFTDGKSNYASEVPNSTVPQNVTEYIAFKDLEGNTALSLAALRGDLQFVKWLVEDLHAEVNQQNSEGNTPLSLAAFNGHLSLVQYLHEKGADCGHKNANATTPMEIAILRGHFDVVKYCHKNGNDINHKNFRGNTPLCIAAHSGQVNIVEYLLDEGADMLQNNNDDDSPLCLASEEGHLETIKCLISRGADVNHKNFYKKNPISIAAFGGHREVVQYYLDIGVDLKKKDKMDHTLLFAASYNGQVEIVDFLKERGLDIFGKDKFGWSLLGVAAMNGHLRLVKYFVEQGLDIHDRNDEGSDAIALAACGNQLGVVKYLHSQGANISAGENSPFLTSCALGHLDIVKYLVEVGVDIHQTDEDGKNGLFIAAEEGKSKVVHYLLLCGVDPTAKDCHGLNALDIAKAYHRSKAVHYIEQFLAGQPISKPQQEATSQQFYKAFLPVANFNIGMLSRKKKH